MKAIIAFFLLSVVLAVSGWFMYDWGKMRDHKELRYATMIDTEATHSTIKGIQYWNTRGIFRDKLTGKVFGDNIGDSLYRQFLRDGNKPIEVSWPYSVDKVEQTSIGIFAMMCAWILWLCSLISIMVGILFKLGEKK